MKLANTPIESITVNGHSLYLKRDDLLHADFSGNKARKFYYLLQQDLTGVDKLIGYGSVQANSLHSLAVLANVRQVTLDYYVAHIPSFLQQNPAGNYLAALEQGANIIDLSAQDITTTVEQYVVEQVLPHQNQALYVPEGGRFEQAKIGLFMLADELITWANEQGIERLKVALPSGTGTTAFYIQQRFSQLNLPHRVLTCACVGGDEYLLSQFNQLMQQDDTCSSDLPTILTANKKYHFGKLYQGFYQLWQQLQQQTGVTFELLYDPLGWITLLDYLDYLDKTSSNATVIYLHQGGVLGNTTMLPRYRRKYDTR